LLPSYEITRNSEQIRIYSISRSSKVIYLGANRTRICNFLSVILINSNSCCFRDIRFRDKARKWLVFLNPPLFDTPIQGNPSEFPDKSYPAKTTLMGLLYSENCKILTSTVLTQQIHETVVESIQVLLWNSICWKRSSTTLDVF